MVPEDVIDELEDRAAAAEVSKTKNAVPAFESFEHVTVD